MPKSVYILGLILYFLKCCHGTPPTIDCEIVITPCPSNRRYDMNDETFDENTNTSDVIYILKASDSDLGHTVTYEKALTTALDPGFVDGYYWFDVTRDTGEVYFIESPDYEAENQFMITWRLSDGTSDTWVRNIKVYLKDINDNFPIFEEILYTFYLPEDSTNDVVVGEVFATDRDAGVNGQITYSLSANSVEGLNVFEMLENGTLIVKNSTTLDYETIVDYTLEANATDMGTPSLSSKHPARIRVLIEDVNDVPPEFRHLPYNVELFENKPEGTSVITIEAIDGDKGVQDKKSIIYTLISDTSGHFGIRNTSGEIYITSPIDRENMTENYYTLEVQATEEGTGQTNTAEVLVTISDENDNLPVFNPKSETYVLDENTPKGLIYLDMTVSDADDTGNNQFSFTLEGGNDAFKLSKPEKKYTSETTVVLSVVEPLDFEEGVTNISLKVIATEVQNILRQSFGDVLIQINDLNDNYPMFENETYQAYIPEDAVIGAHVITIVATDKDAVTKNITYEIIGTGKDKTCFDVSQHTGNVTVSGECEFDIEEGKSSFFFTYQAKDDGGLASTVLLEISLKDVNDNPPVYIRTTPQSPRIPETEDGQFDESKPVATLQFTDADIDESTNGRVVYSMDESSIFRINETTGEIYQTEDADYENKTYYEFLVVAEDKGTPSLSSNVTIRIDVDDINDNAPIFMSSTYEGEIKETADNGEFILMVEATDADSFQNQQIDYAWSSGGDGVSKFSIDQIYGKVIKNGELDWDKGPTEYNLTVIAKDRGEPPLNSTCTVRIKVLDTNDEAPVLKDYVVNIREDANVSQTVTIIKANDSDTTSKLEYEIWLVEAFDDLGVQVKNFHNDHFHLDNSTGELILTNALDQEVIQEYQLTVEVVDLNSITGPQKDSAIITVNVIDLPDEPPKFREDNEAPVIKTVDIDEDVEGEQHNDSCITNVALATDEDDNDPIFYFIVVGNEKCVFHLQNSTGCLTVVKNVNRESTSNYTLIIKATNNMYYEYGQKCPAEKSTSARIQATDPVFDPITDPTLFQVGVQIVDKNDNPPVFTPDVYTAGVSSTYNYGTSILRLVAEDKDVGVNALMEYEIVEEAYYIDDVRQETNKKYFAVNSKDGWITLASIFNSEDTGFFELDVKVVGTGDLTDYASVSIYLMNPSVHQVKAVFDKASDVVYKEEREFTRVLHEGTGFVINIDETKVHLDEDDEPETSRTDMRIHGVNATTNTVIVSRQLIRAIDEAYTIYAELKNTYRVMQVVKAVPDPPPVFDTLNALQWFFFTFSLILIFILSLWAIAFVFWRSSLQRKLKVANAEIYRNAKDIHKEKLPNTNQYQQEGSNPVYKIGLMEKNNRVHSEMDKSSLDEAWKNADEGIDTETNEVVDAAKADGYGDLAFILKDYDQTVGIDNPGNDNKVDSKDNADFEVTDV